jgi:ATP-binding cassette subfamily B (MDR/TAP) protein 1
MLALFFVSSIVALAVQLKLALITLSIIPAMLIVCVVCIANAHKQEARITQVYSRASVLAEEAYSSVKTIHAFWV